jgi:hypothetical protein
MIGAEDSSEALLFRILRMKRRTRLYEVTSLGDDRLLQCATSCWLKNTHNKSRLFLMLWCKFEFDVGELREVVHQA